MGKELKEMSLEELWQLFPIFLVKHDDNWIKYFAEEKKILLSILNDINITRIEHIGSTSIPNIYAKNIVDILIEITEEDYLKSIDVLKTHNYMLMYQERTRAAFNKGYTKSGFAKKVFHIHLRNNGDNDELYFRDYLIEFPKIAKEYEKLKLDLWRKFEHDRDGYTNAKSDFVKRYTFKAKMKYVNRYN